MKTHYLIAFLTAISILTSSCFVTTTKYDEKVKESDVLRKSLSDCRRKNNSLSEEVEKTSKVLSDLQQKFEAATLANKEKEEKIEGLKNMLDDLEKNYGASKISRETLINELLEKEKKYSVMINEMNASQRKVEDDLHLVKTKLDESNQKNRDLLVTLKEYENDKARYAERETEVKRLKSSLDSAESNLHLLQGRVERLQEEVREFLPLANVKQQSSAKLATNSISTFFSGEVSHLLASVPIDAALDEDGKMLAKEFFDFLSSISKICSQEKMCSLHVVATGRTNDGSMTYLTALKELELAFLSALDRSMKKNRSALQAVTKKGRISVVDKMKGIKTNQVNVDIFVVRNGGA